MNDKKSKGVGPPPEAADRVFNQLDGPAPDSKPAAAPADKAPKAVKAKSGGKKPPPKSRRLLLTLVVFAAFFALLVSGIAVGGYVLLRQDRNFPKVYIDGIDVGGMNREETLKALDENDWDKRVGKKLKVLLPAEQSFEVDYISSGAKLGKEAAAELAYDFGRDNSILKIPFVYLKSKVISTDVDRLEKSPNEAYIKDCIGKALKELEKSTADRGVTVDDEKGELRMLKGAGRISLDAEGLYNSVLGALLSNSELLEYTDLDGELETPDFNKLNEDFSIAPADAYFDENFDVITEVVGRRFDAEEAKKLWDKADVGEELIIPLERLEPETTAEQLSSLLYANLLGSQTTSYKWSSDNRIGNIKLVAQKLDGHIMLPGEVFSFNDFVGQRTEEAGFRLAGAYNDGQVVEAIGGGICQVSSTLYCASMYAQMKTVSRTNHYFKVDYLERGYDATVSWKKPDFKFSNSRDFPIKLAAFCDDDSQTITIEIWGTDIDGSYVTLRTVTGEIYDKEYTDTLIGHTVTLYRSVFDADGNFLYEKAEPSGAYYLHEEQIQWPAEKEDEDDYLSALSEIENSPGLTEDEYLSALEDLYR